VNVIALARIMNNGLWKLPFPATALFGGPFLKVLAKHQCEIAFSLEPDSGSEKWLSLLFEGVEAFKCTYLTSLATIDQNLRKEAYGTLISVENSPWLTSVQGSCAEYHTAATTTPMKLHHLMICFDDGPCFEFICAGFRNL